MLKLNRKTEYALLTLRYMSKHDHGAVISVREIAEHYTIPEMLLAKVLQQLKRGAVVSSVKGSSGGYVMTDPPVQVRLTDVLDLFDEQIHLVDCIDHADACDCVQQTHCDIRMPMAGLNALIMRQLRALSLADFFECDMVAAKRPRHLAIYRSESA